MALQGASKKFDTCFPFYRLNAKVLCFTLVERGGPAIRLHIETFQSNVLLLSYIQKGFSYQIIL